MSNLRAIGSLALLDLRLWLKSPAAVVSALLPPLGMALLLAVLAMSVTEQPVALVVQAHGPYATRMEKLIRKDEEAYMLRATDAATAEHLLETQEVAAIITIPADFDRKAANHDATVHLKLYNADIDFADDIRRAVDRSVGEFDAPSLGPKEETEAGEEKPGEAAKEGGVSAGESAPGEGGAQGAKEKTEAELEHDEEEAEKDTGPYALYVDPAANPYHIVIEEQDLRVTQVDFLHYQLIPVLVLLILNVGMTGTALLCAGDGERGTARLLVLAPVSAWALVVGRLLGGLIASLLVLIPAVGLCMAAHIITIPAGHGWALTALFFVIALAAAGLGAALGTMVRGSRNVAMAASVLATYLFLMGGGFTTIAFLPAWLRTVSAFDPMRYAIDGVREALFYPALTGFSTNLAVLTGTAVASVLIGAVLVVRSWRR